MPTTKKRLNVTLSPELEQIIKLLAERDDVPEATKAASLLKTAIEIEEDEILNKLAEARDTKGAKFISHEKTWA
jgi:predicted Zn-ribbon and HTH transcriptional regulator